MLFQLALLCFVSSFALLSSADPMPMEPGRLPLRSPEQMAAYKRDMNGAFEDTLAALAYPAEWERRKRQLGSKDPTAKEFQRQRHFQRKRQLNQRPDNSKR